MPSEMKLIFLRKELKFMKMLKNIGVFALTGMVVFSLVGCGDGSGGDRGETDPATVETELTNAMLEGTAISADGTVLRTSIHFTPEPAGHGNPRVEGGPNWSLGPLIYDPLADFSSQPEPHFEPRILESFEWESGTLTMTLREGLRFSDGTDITMDDLITNLFNDMGPNQLQSNARSVEIIDDYTLIIEFTQDSLMLKTLMLTSPLHFLHEEYSDFAERFRYVFENHRVVNDQGNYDLTYEGMELHDQIMYERNNYLPRITEIRTSGPFVPTNITASELTLTRNPYYRIPVHIETIIGLRPTSAESTILGIQNNDFDIESEGLSIDLALSVAQSNRETIRQMIVPEFSQFGLLFNVNSYPTNQLEVRRAIAHIIDREQITPATEPGMIVGDAYATALPQSIRDTFLTRDDLDAMTRFDLNLEKAAEYLESIGWTRENGVWVDEDGVSPEIILGTVAEWQAYLVMGEASVKMLEDFGLNATLAPREAAAYSDFAVSGQAHIIIDGFGSAPNNQHPFEAFNGIWWFGQRMNLEFPTTGPLLWMNELTGEYFNYSEAMHYLMIAGSPEEANVWTNEIASFFNDNMWYFPIVEKYYIFRIHNPNLSLAPAETGTPLSDFYWSGTVADILGKLFRSGDIFFVE